MIVFMIPLMVGAIIGIVVFWKILCKEAESGDDFSAGLCSLLTVLYFAIFLISLAGMVVIN